MAIARAAENVWLARGGTGHASKPSPAVGEVVANAIVNGADVPALFRLDRLRGAKAKPQFES